MSDNFVLGDHNASCFECGRKRKASELKRHWQGYWVCPDHWEPRHPQDFAGPVAAEEQVPFAQPQEDTFIAPFPEPLPYDPTNE